jgi:hypothetical protein
MSVCGALFATLGHITEVFKKKTISHSLDKLKLCILTGVKAHATE